MALEVTAKPMEIDPKASSSSSGKSEDLMIHTPPLGSSRKPAKLRLSTSTSKKALLSNPDDTTLVLEEEFPLTDKKRSLYEPLGPSTGRSHQPSFPDGFLPPPDFETAAYPRGWVIGKKRKLVNVDVVESMRRIAVQEMNRKDREINELNEQLEEDSRTMEHLQMQLQQERTKRAHIERENTMLQGQVNMLMTMIPEQEPEDGETFET